jgi:hypothetical protein
VEFVRLVEYLFRFSVGCHARNPVINGVRFADKFQDSRHICGQMGRRLSGLVGDRQRYEFVSK